MQPTAASRVRHEPDATIQVSTTADLLQQDTYPYLVCNAEIHLARRLVTYPYKTEQLHAGARRQPTVSPRLHTYDASSASVAEAHLDSTNPTSNV